VSSLTVGRTGCSSVFSHCRQDWMFVCLLSLWAGLDVRTRCRKRLCIYVCSHKCRVCLRLRKKRDIRHREPNFAGKPKELFQTERIIYLSQRPMRTQHTTNKTDGTSMSPVGFEPTIPAVGRLQTAKNTDFM
jgi:hypothetical protein